MNQFDKQHQANVRKYQRRIDAIYKKAAEQAAARAASLPVPDDYIFTFDDFPAVKKQIDALMATMAADVELTVTDGIRAEWGLSNAKNDALVDSVLGDAASLARYHRTHEEVLNAFLERKQNGLGLSDRVWRYTDQFKSEIEMGLDLGIRDGEDAASIARSIQQYLQYPDMLFRRIKDEHGVFHLSQRAAAFHPGQGVYRSSYKNALRLAATETNIAYRTADHERWQDLDFIVGIEVHLSNNHTILNHKKERVALFDICDELQGKYPKEFKFVGWHPNCRCIATQIFKTKAEMDADDERLKRGEEPLDPHQSENAVTEMPDGWNKWMEDNAERLENAKTMPYFIQDNFKDGDPSQGLRWMENEQSRMIAIEKVVNSVDDVIAHDFGVVPSPTDKEFLNFGKENLIYTYNTEARQYAGLRQETYERRLQEAVEIRSKFEKTPQEVIKAIDFYKVHIEQLQYEMRKSANETVKFTISTTIALESTSIKQLNEWFDTRIVDPRFFNKKWKAFYNKHKEMFK